MANFGRHLYIHQTTFLDRLNILLVAFDYYHPVQQSKSLHLPKVLVEEFSCRKVVMEILVRTGTISWQTL